MHRPFCLFAGSAFCLLLSSAVAATKQKAEDAQLQKVLAAEAKGGASARDQDLAGLIESAPDYAPARWAAGYVEGDGKWLRFNEWSKSDLENDELAEYWQMRDSLPDTAEGHLKLANWCREHGLREQERVHLLRVLDFEPDRVDLRRRAGMVEVGGVWMSPQEARQAAARGKQAAVNLKHWLPKVERMRSAVNGPEGRLRDLALENVRGIRDVSAIVALETVLAPSSDDAGVAVVDALSAMKRPEAAIALARLGTFSQSSDTTDAARDNLKTQSRDYFVPAMLSSLVIPSTRENRLVFNRYGRLIFEQAFLYERSDRKIAAVFDNVYQEWQWWGVGQVRGAPLLAASTLGSARAAQRTIAFDAVNRQIERTNRRIIETLNAVTAQKLPADPSAWWNWWDYVNETVASGKKPTQVAYYEEDTLLANYQPPPQRHCACLIAGTPILTDHGPVAVDQVKVGDRVLAQDSVSGELAYKPVLRTTVRPRAPLIHISLADETIVASGGHPFWISGQGWVNARQLQPGMLVHTVTGTVRVENIKIEEEGKLPVYNLVVEDFHSYFAGTGQLLLHDITPREPALGPVPGWKE